MNPQARTEGLVVQDVANEFVVFDRQRKRAHHLNQTAALVWQNCDGNHSVDDLALLLGKEFKGSSDKDLVWLTLDSLDKAHLMQNLVIPSHEAPIRRRQMLRKIALVGGVAVVLPVVHSIVAPSPAMAQSPR